MSQEYVYGYLHKGDNDVIIIIIIIIIIMIIIISVVKISSIGVTSRAADVTHFFT